MYEAVGKSEYVDFVRVVADFRSDLARQHGTYPVADPRRRITDPKITPKEADAIYEAFNAFGEELIKFVDAEKLHNPLGPRKDLTAFQGTIAEAKRVIAARDIDQYMARNLFSARSFANEKEFADTMQAIAPFRTFEQLTQQRYENAYLFVPDAGWIFEALSRFGIALSTYSWTHHNIDAAWKRMIKSVGESVLEVPQTVRDWSKAGWDGAGRFVGEVGRWMTLTGKILKWTTYAAIGGGAFYLVHTTRKSKKSGKRA